MSRAQDRIPRIGDHASSRVIRRTHATDHIPVPSNTWRVKCFGPLAVLDPERIVHALRVGFKRLPGEIVSLAMPGFREPTMLVDRSGRLVVAQRFTWKLYDSLRRLVPSQLLAEIERGLSGADTLKWAHQQHNLVTTVGRNMVRGYLDGLTWYGELVSATPTIIAGNTHAVHAGWTEFTAYDEADRVALVLAANGDGQVDNSVVPHQVTIDTNGSSIGGIAAVQGGAAPETKGSTAGDVSLYSAVAFSGGNKAADDGDTLESTYTLTDADDGV